MTISVTNNPDGTFTVSCGTETVVVGTLAVAPARGPRSSGLPPLSTTGGFGTAQIIDSTHPPAEARSAESVDALMSMLRLENVSRPTGGAAAAEHEVIHFKMTGIHTLDAGSISELASYQGDRLAVRIHMVR